MAQSKARDVMASHTFKVDRDPSGLKTLYDSNRSLNEAEKLFSWAEKFYLIIKFLKHATTVVAIGNNALVYVGNINGKFELKVKAETLEQQGQTLRSEGSCK